MFRENPRLKSLELRKQLLVAESELNRADLAMEWHSMAGTLASFTQRARTFGSVAWAAGSLVGGLMAFRRARTNSASGKVPWWRSLVKGAQMAGAIWSEFASPRKASQATADSRAAD